jgi:hypothetical protein
MSDIVEKLREGETEGVDGWWFVMAEGANEIERLRAENEKLDERIAITILVIAITIDKLQTRIRELESLAGTMPASRVQQKLIEQNACIIELQKALQPFAYYAEQIPDDVSDMAAASGTVGDLRRAREVLGEK